MGYKVNLHLFDTERISQNIDKITQQIDSINPHLIIGPIYASEYKAMSEKIQNKNIPMIYPLSARNESITTKNPGFVQVKPSSNAIIDEMVAWLQTRPDTTNVILLSMPESEDNKNTNTDNRLYLVSRLDTMANVVQYIWGQPVKRAVKKTDNDEAENDDPFLFLLSEEHENLIFLPSINEGDVNKVLSGLLAYAGSYRISVVGFAEWQDFTSIDHEAFFKLNTTLFTYSYNDNTNKRVNWQSAKYRHYFNSEPSSIACRAYDMTLYFSTLALTFKGHVLEQLQRSHYDGFFSRFYFKPLPNGGLENHGLYIINYTKDYQILISKWTNPFESDNTDIEETDESDNNFE